VWRGCECLGKRRATRLYAISAGFVETCFRETFCREKLLIGKQSARTCHAEAGPLKLVRSFTLSMFFMQAKILAPRRACRKPAEFRR
jgi:hypothetical protein